MFIITIGLLLIVAGTAMPLFGITGDVYKYIYAAGALVLLIGHLSASKPRDVSLRLKRMMRLETWSAIIFVFATVIIFMPGRLGVGPRDWIAFTMAGGVLQAYTSIMIPRLKKKEPDNGADK